MLIKKSNPSGAKNYSGERAYKNLSWYMPSSISILVYDVVISCQVKNLQIY